jgi:hypothetical protein
MSEASMVQLLQHALERAGIDDRIIAAGQFNPRGHSGGLFAGGLAGDELAGSIGGGAGSIAGMHAADAASGLPAKMLVGVTPETVYGFEAATRRSEPTALVFRVERAGLTAKVHQRVNVRVLELIDDATGARIELEGNRVPATHAKDVIEAVTRVGDRP